jgi:TonB-dependent starch-binding outer membrane protein SusC
MPKNKIIQQNNMQINLRIIGIISMWLLGLCIPDVQAQKVQKTLHLKVVDRDNNDPLGGVVVGSTLDKRKTVLTNEEGRFTITLSETDTIIVSHIGYESQKLAVRNIKSTTISLKTSATQLDDVIIIGYGTAKKDEVAGSIAKVDIEDMKKAPVTSFEQALQGRIAGLQVSANDGQPGDEMNVIIRGGNSLTQSNAPLYVIDGFPIEDPSLASINPDDIASISILKDAASTAIYGARGANGVIVIETKTGKEGKPSFSYQVNYGMQETHKRMELMNPYEFVKYQLDFNPTRANSTYLINGRTLDDYKNMAGTDWQEAIFRKGAYQQHNISVTGGTKQSKYMISAAILDQEGMIINSGFKRYQGRISLDQTFSKNITFRLRADYSSQEAYGQRVSTSTVDATGATAYLLFGTWGYRPVTGKEEENLEDDLFDPEIQQSTDSRVNPVVSAKNEYNKNKVQNLNANAFINFNLIKGLDFKVSGGVNNRNNRVDEFYNSNTARGNTRIFNNIRGVNGAINFPSRSSWTNENTLSYNKQINKNHRINSVIGFTMQEVKTSDYGFASQKIADESLGMPSLALGTPYQIGAMESRNTLMSFLGRVNYNYRSKYTFELSMRADGSSKFAPGNRWGYFPAGSFAWLVGREKFIKNLKVVSNAKIRTSYGLSGNNRVGDFSYLSTIGYPIANAYSFQNQTPLLGSWLSNIGNESLTWETTAQLDLGLDLSWFQDRINLTVDYYNKETKDLLLNADIPTTTGYNRVFKNVGRIQNKGWEFALSTINIKTNNFSWQSNFNISFNKNKVLELSDNQEVFQSRVQWTSTFNGSFLYLTKVGAPVSQFYGYAFDGVYQYSDFDQLVDGSYRLKAGATDNGTDRTTVQPGDIKYKDMNGDLVVNEQDMVVIGRTLPKHIGGFSNVFSYKSFTLSALLQWSYGNDVFNANRVIFEGNEINRNNVNQFASYQERWTPTNPSNTLFRAGGTGPLGAYSSRTIEDGSYLRLKTVAITYALPKGLISRIGLSKLQVSASGQNLITWTKYSGMDPEVSVRNTILTPGFDYSAYPLPRTIVFGLQATF